MRIVDPEDSEEILEAKENFRIELGKTFISDVVTYYYPLIPNCSLLLFSKYLQSNSVLSIVSHRLLPYGLLSSFLLFFVQVNSFTAMLFKLNIKLATD